jgi:TRAP-type uncharacterized transport system substrate-binding protein
MTDSINTVQLKKPDTYTIGGLITYIFIVSSIILLGYYLYKIYKKHLSKTNQIETFLDKASSNDKNLIEGFTSTNFNEHSLLFPKIEKEITLTIDESSNPTLLIGTSSKGTYPPVLGYYISKNIYPSLVYYSKGSLASILGLLTGQVDIAIVDEDILMSCFDASDNNDKYIQKGFKNMNLPLSILDGIEKKISYISSLYYQPMLLITKEGTGISNIIHLKSSYTNKVAVKPSLGVMDRNGNSYYHLMKLLKLSDISMIEDVNVIIYDNQEEMFKDFNTTKLDVVYLTSNQKNKGLLELSNEIKLRFISPFATNSNFISSLEESYTKDMPIITFNDRNINRWTNLSNKNIGLLTKEFKNLKNLLDNTGIVRYRLQTYKNVDQLFNALLNNEVSLIYLPDKTDRKQLLDGLNNITTSSLYFLSPSLSTNQLVDVYTDDNNNRIVMEDLIKRQFPQSHKYTLDLSSFYQNINTHNFVETRATRMILICRSNIEDDIIEYFTTNLVKELDNLKIDINQFLFNKKLNNVDATSFKLEELASAPIELQIHEGSKRVYRQLGLIKEVETEACDYN